MTKKILIVFTSHNKHSNDKPTGYWAEEFCTPYYMFKDAGHEITLASPAGGQPPLDPNSLAPDFLSEGTRRYDADSAAQEQVATTKKLSSVSAADFDAVFYPGGHGPMYDLYSDKDSIKLIEDFLRAGKPVSAVCHGPVVLLKPCNPDGSSILKGKAVTGFTNTEEEAVGLTKVVPYLLEEEMKKCGGIYRRANDWTPHCEADGLIITGQNPMSSEAVAAKLLSVLA